MKAIVYTDNMCKYSKMTIDFLRENGVEVTTKNISVKKYLKEMIDLTRQMGVPVTILEKNIVIGFDKRRFSELLGLTYNETEEEW